MACGSWVCVEGGGWRYGKEAEAVTVAAGVVVAVAVAIAVAVAVAVAAAVAVVVVVVAGLPVAAAVVVAARRLGGDRTRDRSWSWCRCACVLAVGVRQVTWPLRAGPHWPLGVGVVARQAGCVEGSMAPRQDTAAATTVAVGRQLGVPDAVAHTECSRSSSRAHDVSTSSKARSSLLHSRGACRWCGGATGEGGEGGEEGEEEEEEEQERRLRAAGALKPLARGGRSGCSQQNQPRSRTLSLLLLPLSLFFLPTSHPSALPSCNSFPLSFLFASSLFRPLPSPQLEPAATALRLLPFGSPGSILTGTSPLPSTALLAAGHGRHVLL